MPSKVLRTTFMLPARPSTSAQRSISLSSEASPSFSTVHATVAPTKFVIKNRLVSDTTFFVYRSHVAA